MPDWTAKSQAELDQAYANALAKVDDPKLGARARSWLEEIDLERQRRSAEISGMHPQDAQAIREAVRDLSLEERVVRAFEQMPPSDAEALAVRIVHQHPRSTTRELTELAGWPGETTWHLIFGNMCQKREPWLPQPPASEGRPGQLFYSGILCTLHRPKNRFELKPEAARGFARVGLLARAAS
jgi:hypothetical protein